MTHSMKETSRHLKVLYLITLRQIKDISNQQMDCNLAERSCSRLTNPHCKVNNARIFSIKGRNVKKFILIFMFTLALSSCATTRWDHPTKSQTSSYLDLLHCKQTATLYANETGLAHDEVFIKNESEKCMSEKYGWAKEKDYPIRYYLPFPFNLFLA